MGYARIPMYGTQLLSGVPAQEVIASMTTVFKTDWSLKNYMSRVRVYVLDSDDDRKFHPMYHKDIKKLVRFARKRQDTNKEQVCHAVQEFTKLPFRQQYQRRLFRRAGISVFGDDDVDAMLSKVHFVTKNILEFRTSLAHARECRRKTEERRLIANENRKQVDDVTIKLNECRAIIALAANAHRDGYVGDSAVASVPRVAIALLTVSGRRSAEVLNCKSLFEPGSNIYSTQFTGQLKTRLSDSYEIPLLCLYSDFRDAYAYLKRHAPRTETSHVNSRYASNLGYWSKRMFGPNVTPHDLRRIYASYIYEAYIYTDIQVSTNAVIKWLLGHSGLSTSLNYTGIQAGGITELFDTNYRLPLPKTKKTE